MPRHLFHSTWPFLPIREIMSRHSRAMAHRVLQRDLSRRDWVLEHEVVSDKVNERRGPLDPLILRFLLVRFGIHVDAPNGAELGFGRAGGVKEGGGLYFYFL